SADSHQRAASCQLEIQAILAYLPQACALQQTPFPTRIVHNDAKVANILFNESGEAALAVIDLDTTQPGCALHDYGDMLRSMTCRAAEDCQDINQVKVNPSYAEAVRRGWLQGCGDLLTPLEIAHMPLAGAWISTELAARFLADYLSGDLYFQTSRPQQNLDRARVQLQIAMQLASLQE
ncbi:MAG: phosphotransferase, partial [Planctomycetes bacterium]|nr:phosphotransferase [Planctomycetota bacterium]